MHLHKNDLEPDCISLWEFRAEEFAAWKELTGDGCPDYRTYMDMLVAVQADQERQGRFVVRVHCSVAKMFRELSVRDLPNNPAGRAAVIGLLAAEKDFGD